MGRVEVRRCERRAWRAGGSFRIDLQAIDTGNPLRDRNVRETVFGGRKCRTAGFELLEALPIDGSLGEILSGKELETRCKGAIVLNEKGLKSLFELVFR